VTISCGPFFRTITLECVTRDPFTLRATFLTASIIRNLLPCFTGSGNDPAKGVEHGNAGIRGAYFSYLASAFLGSTNSSMRAAIYARVSTLNGQSPEMQLVELREYASPRGWEVFREYVDLGISGSKESRPELNRLMADAHARRFDVVLCWKVDRFGPSLKHLVNALADLDSYGVAFVSLSDNLDLSTPSGRLMFQIAVRQAHVSDNSAPDSQRRRDGPAARAGRELPRDCRGSRCGPRHGAYTSAVGEVKQPSGSPRAFL